MPECLECLRQVVKLYPSRYRRHYTVCQDCYMMIDYCVAMEKKADQLAVQEILNAK